MLIVVWLRIGLPRVTSPIVSPRCNSRGLIAIIPHPKLPVIFSRLNGESIPKLQNIRVYKENRWGDGLPTCDRLVSFTLSRANGHKIFLL